ncbi:2'-5' RNA ligase family protein [Mucilaginibacter sp. UYCu711]|uniref:2'-5' RNA ligase family protein n=1 Tax=Mucilaginibacter sp. UYCu711 TaxID=3156339 RepID=UPI003D23C119
MQPARLQLTLFVSHQNQVIEKIRLRYNPVQFDLIAAHVTLCREHELVPMDMIIENIHTLVNHMPIKIEFGPPARFDNGKGVLIPAKKTNPEFYELRRLILNGTDQLPTAQQPHITLMHPRNSTCTDDVFNEIKNNTLPTQLTFDTISLIEQRDGGRWTVLEEFEFGNKRLKPR